MRSITLRLRLEKSRDKKISDFLDTSRRLGISLSETLRQGLEFLDNMRMHNPQLYGLGLTPIEKIQDNDLKEYYERISNVK